MKVLLFLTGHRQVKEYDYFNRFLQRLPTLGKLCDVFIHCNNPAVSGEIAVHFRQFPQETKHLFITSLNAGFQMGPVEAVSGAIEMGIFKGYDYVIHLHPDVFITEESRLVEILEENIDNDCVFLVNKSVPDDARFFSFDFFIFKPRLLTKNIFLDDLYTYRDIPEHYLHEVITRNGIAFKVTKRFQNDRWHPRRVDEHLKLYHEHDLQLVEALLTRLSAADGSSGVETTGWQPPVVELRPSLKR